MRSLADILGEKGAEAFGDPGAGQALAAATPGSIAGAQVNSLPLGSLTGAPPRTQLRGYQIVPYGALGSGQQATRIVEPDLQNRVIILTAPFVAFNIWIGDSGVKPGDFSLPPGLPYEVILPGRQPLYAVTDAPVYLPLRVQIASILMGERERKL